MPVPKGKMMKIFKKIFELIKSRFKQLVSYGFWGVCTTGVNVLAYALLRLDKTFSVAASTSIAWVVAVLFAFFTNRIFVFHSDKRGFAAVFKEMAMFFAMRLFSGLVDVGLMWFLMLGNPPVMPEIAAKIFTNIVVIVMNYFLSIFIVFAKKTSKNEENIEETENITDLEK